MQVLLGTLVEVEALAGRGWHSAVGGECVLHTHLNKRCCNGAQQLTRRELVVQLLGNPAAEPYRCSSGEPYRCSSDGD